MFQLSVWIENINDMEAEESSVEQAVEKYLKITKIVSVLSKIVAYCKYGACGDAHSWKPNVGAEES